MGVTVVKEALVGAEYGDKLPTGKVRLVVLTEFSDEDDGGKIKYKPFIAAPYLDADSTRDITSPMNLLGEIKQEWEKGKKIPYRVRSLQYANGGTQVIFTVVGPTIFEVREVEEEVVGKVGKKQLQVVKKNVETGNHPFDRFKVGDVQFDVNVVIVHRYDKAKSRETHVELMLGGLSIFLKKQADDNTSLLATIKSLFDKLQTIKGDKAQAVKIWLFKHLTGYAKRLDIPATQVGTIRKFEEIARHVQKFGVNVFGDTALAVLWGALSWAESEYCDQTLENDFISDNQAKMNARFKMDALMESVVCECGQKMP